MLEIVETWQFGDYHFQVLINPSNVAARMQRDVFYKIGQMEYTFLRSFYFDDIVPETIHAFCELFANDVAYRQASLSRTTAWAIRNDLFLRNCFNPYFQRNPVLERCGSMVGAYHFFKDHALQIIQQPDYQRIYEYDSAIEAQALDADPAIANSIAVFNQISGVRTLASCQGVLGTVAYQAYDLLTLSPHARYGYIWFARLPQDIEVILKKARFSSTIYRDDIYPSLESTGNNAAFLREIAQLATKLKGTNP